MYILGRENSAAREQVRDQCKGDPRYEAISSVRSKEKLFRTYQATVAQLERHTAERAERALSGFKVIIRMSPKTHACSPPEHECSHAFRMKHVGCVRAVLTERLCNYEIILASIIFLVFILVGLNTMIHICAVTVNLH